MIMLPSRNICLTSFSKTLPATDVKLKGLLLLVTQLSSLQNINVTFACFQSSATLFTCYYRYNCWCVADVFAAQVLSTPATIGCRVALTQPWQVCTDTFSYLARILCQFPVVCSPSAEWDCRRGSPCSGPWTRTRSFCLGFRPCVCRTGLAHWSRLLGSQYCFSFFFVFNYVKNCLSLDLASVTDKEEEEEERLWAVKKERIKGWGGRIIGLK